MNGPLSTFGPAVIGHEAHEAQQKILETGAHIFGPAVIGEQPPAAPSATPPPPPAEPNALSVKELEAELEANPARFDELYHGEFLRPGGPRKGALGVLLKAERQDQNRPEVLESLQGLLDGGAE